MAKREWPEIDLSLEEVKGDLLVRQRGEVYRARGWTLVDRLVEFVDLCVASGLTSALQDGHPARTARLIATNEGVRRGHTLIRFTGSFDVPVVPATAFEPEHSGMQLLIEDLGRTEADGVVVDLAAPGFVIPAGERGSGCAARDGWVSALGGKVRTYLNQSGSVDAPSCTPGSAAGLRMLKVRDSRRAGGGIDFRARILAPRWDIVGPLRGTLTLGTNLDAGGVGACAVARFAAGECVTRAGREKVTCAVAAAR